MVNKCCVPNCNSNYRVTKKDPNFQRQSVYKFPKDKDECNEWIAAIPRKNLFVTEYTVVCRLHWPEDAEFISLRGRNFRPKNPPSLFPNIPKSCLRSTLSKKRSSQKCLSEQRHIQEDELNKFKIKDALDYNLLLTEVPKKYQNIIA